MRLNQLILHYLMHMASLAAEGCLHNAQHFDLVVEGRILKESSNFFILLLLNHCIITGLHPHRWAILLLAPQLRMGLNNSIKKYLIKPLTANNCLMAVNLLRQPRKHIIILQLALLYDHWWVALPLKLRHSNLPSLLKAFWQTHDLFDHFSFVSRLIECCLEKSAKA